MTNRLRFLFVSGLLLGAFVRLDVQSVVLDPTLGNGSSLGNGPTYGITETMGRTIGSNLFHSFSRFSLLGGETAEFTTAGTIQNILARVTGAEASTIDGTIRSPANLFFLNPNGVVFNSGATLAIDGSFHASTADYLRMGATAFYVDETRAGPNLPSVLSVDPGVLLDPPTAFGFSAENPAPITVNGSTLEMAEGGRIGVVGGDITLVGGALRADGGRIDVASVGSEGEVDLTEQGLDTSSFSLSGLGQLRLSGDATMDVSEAFFSPNGAGRLIIRAGRLEVDSSILRANTTFNGGGVIDIDVTGAIILSNGAAIASWTLGEGAAAPIRIFADDIEVRGGSEIRSLSTGPGRAGDVTVDAFRTILMSDPEGSGPFANGIESNVFLGTGGGGDITITAPTITIERSHISADVRNTVLEETVTSGRPGSIRIQTNNLVMSDGSTIQNNVRNSSSAPTASADTPEIWVRPLDVISHSSIRLTGPGTKIQSRASDSSQDSSNIRLEADRIRLSGVAGIDTTVSSGSASAGRVDVIADRLTLEGGSFIDSESLSEATGDAGTISVRASESVTLRGRDGDFRSQMSSTTRGGGNGGQVSVTVNNVDRTGTLVVTDDAVIQSNNRSGLDGVRGGDVRIDADVVRVDNGGFIESVAGSGSRGAAGNVTIGATESISVRGTNADLFPSFVSTSTFGDGSGGTIRLSAPSIVVADGAVIDSLTTGSGSGGTVQIGRDVDLPIATRELSVQNEGRIVVDSRGFGDGAGRAGSISVDVARLVLDGGGQITATTTDGDGGSITIRASESVSLEDLGAASLDTVISTATFGGGEGGRVSVNATNGDGTGSVFIDGAAIESNNFSDLDSPAGGDVRIDADVVRIENGGLVASAAANGILGAAGNVTIGATSLLTIRGFNADGFRSRVTTATGGAGPAGELRLSADRIVVADGARIDSLTNNTGSGGTIRIGRAADLPIDTRELLVQNSAGISASSSATGDGAGRAGSVIVDVDRLDLETGGFITAITFDGDGGQIAIGAASSMSLGGQSIVSSATLGEGPGGGVRLSAGRIAVTDGSVVSSTTGLTGDGGRVRIGRSADVPIDTQELFVQDAIISAQSVALGESAGAAGSVSVDVARLVLDAGGQIAASTFDGTGGTIAILASESAKFSGLADGEFPSGVFTDTSGTGVGGSVTIDTPRLEMSARAHVASIARAGSSATAGDINLRVGEMDLSGRALVSAESIGTGSAGVIDIGGRGEAGQPAQSLVSRNGRITTESLQAGGGSIALDANLVLVSEDSLITTNVASGTESGNVRINARFLELDNSNVTADGGEGAGGNIAIVVDPTNDTGNSQFPPGFLVLKDTSEVRADGGNQGGKINISAAGFTASQTSLVQARARQPAGVDGEVGIQALIAGVSESITPLPGNFLDAAALLRARCAERASGGETSSFIAAGRDGLPPEPGGLLSSSVFDLVPASRAASRGAGSKVPAWRRPNPTRFWYTPRGQSCDRIAGGRR